MPRHTENDINLISYLAALCLTISSIESSLPHALPFLRLGLANIPLLWALDRLGKRDYLLLCLIKWLLSSVISGLIASPFALVALSGSAASALAALAVYSCASRWLSLYSVSAVSSFASGAAQLAASSLFLTGQVMRLLPLVLAFNTVSGLITAFAALHLEPAESIEIDQGCGKEERGRGWILALHALGLLAILLNDSLILLALSFMLSLLLCRLSGRRIRMWFYLAGFVCVVFFNLLVPSGRVLWGPVTSLALYEGVSRGLRLIALTALSQPLAGLDPGGKGLLARTLAIHGQLSQTFFASEGTLPRRVRAALEQRVFRQSTAGGKRESLAAALPVNLLLAALCLLSLALRQM